MMKIKSVAGLRRRKKKALRVAERFYNLRRPSPDLTDAEVCEARIPSGYGIPCSVRSAGSRLRSRQVQQDWCWKNTVVSANRTTIIKSSPRT